MLQGEILLRDALAVMAASGDGSCIVVRVQVAENAYKIAPLVVHDDSTIDDDSVVDNTLVVSRWFLAVIDYCPRSAGRERRDVSLVCRRRIKMNEGIKIGVRGFDLMKRLMELNRIFLKESLDASKGHKCDRFRKF